jgi:ribonuclease BN (tRNA processing enzyme)
MKIHFLGTGAGNFRGSRRQPCSSFLEGLLLDCGAGATGRLHDIHRFDQVDAVLITHLHSDHVAGLFDFFLHTLITGRKRPLVVVSPPGLGKVLRAFFDVKGTVVDPSNLYDLRLIEGDQIQTTVGPWTIRSVALDHSILDLGYLLTSDGVSVFYTGDTREPSAACNLRADILIHEATFPDRAASMARAYGHSTGSHAGETAVAMHARRLLVNHIGDQPDSDAEIAREAKQVFPESVVVEDRTTIDL